MGVHDGKCNWCREPVSIRNRVTMAGGKIFHLPCATEWINYLRKVRENEEYLMKWGRKKDGS